MTSPSLSVIFATTQNRRRHRRVLVWTNHFSSISASQLCKMSVSVPHASDAGSRGNGYIHVTLLAVPSSCLTVPQCTSRFLLLKFLYVTLIADIQIHVLFFFSAGLQEHSFFFSKLKRAPRGASETNGLCLHVSDSETLRPASHLELSCSEKNDVVCNCKQI